MTWSTVLKGLRTNIMLQKSNMSTSYQVMSSLNIEILLDVPYLCAMELINVEIEGNFTVQIIS